MYNVYARVYDCSMVYKKGKIGKIFVNTEGGKELLRKFSIKSFKKT